MDVIEGEAGAPFADVLKKVLPDNAAHVRAGALLGRTPQAIYQSLHATGATGRVAMREQTVHELAGAAGYEVRLVLVPIAEAPAEDAPKPRARRRTKAGQ